MPLSRWCALVLSLLFILYASTAQTQWKVAGGFSTDWQNLKVDVQELAPRTYLLHASGGNVVASVGPEGTLLVDTEFAQAAPRLKEALAGLRAGPVRYVISTHYHSDHTGANGIFHRDGAVLIAQDNCRARQLEPQVSRYWGTTAPPVPADEAATITYDHLLTVHWNGGEIRAIHNRPAHTDGDTVVYMREANVVHMGDIFVNGLYPYIDLGVGGNIDGYFPVIDEVLAMIDDKTKVIPGHGPVATRAELQSYREMLKTVRDRVAVRVAAGATLEQIIADDPSREFNAKWASDRVGPEAFTAFLYQSLTGKRLEWRLSSK